MSTYFSYGQLMPSVTKNYGVGPRASDCVEEDMSTPFDVRAWARQAGIQTTGGFAVVAECVTIDELQRFAEIAISQAAKHYADRDTALLRQALEALEAMQSYARAEGKGLRICDETVEALKERLNA